jgi:hypothetical protein
MSLLTPTLTAAPKSSSTTQNPLTGLPACRPKELYEFAYTYPYSHTKVIFLKPESTIWPLLV